MDLAWLSLAALVLVVVVSCTMRVNPGVVAIALAWVIAVYIAPLFGKQLGIAALAAGFPADLFLTLVGVSVLFTQADGNGTLARVAEGAQRLCHGNVGLMPVLFFLFAFGLGSLGPGNIAVAGLLAPIAMSAARRAGIPPFLMAIMVGHGAISSTLSPFTAAGILANQLLAKMDLGGHQWEVYLYNATANAAVALAGYLIFGGWKLFGKSRVDSAALTNQADDVALPSETSPNRLTRRHLVTLAVIAALVAGVVAGKMHIGMAAFAAAAFLSIFRLADEGETVRKVPWSVILMICGVSVLTSLLDQTGGTLRFAETIDRFSTPGTVTGVLALVTGIVSVYSSTTGVVLPAFLPIVKQLITVQSYHNPLALGLAVLVGGNLVDMSPLSTIGALCVAGTPDETERRTLFNQLLAWGFAQAVVGALLCWLLFRPM